MKHENKMNKWFYYKSNWETGEDCFPVEHYVGGPEAHICEDIYENEEDARERVQFLNNAGITFKHVYVSDSNTTVEIDWNGVM